MITKSIFAGFGGQGVLLMGYVTALAAMRQGKHVTYLPAYGAEIRGGTANCTVAMGDEEIASPVASAPDFIVVMNNPSLVRFASLVKPGGTIVTNSTLVRARVNRDDVRLFQIPANDLANGLNAPRSANVVMLGALCEIVEDMNLDSLKAALGETGLGKKPDIYELNLRAMELGADHLQTIH